MRIPLRKIDLSFANVIKDMIMSGVQSGIDITFSTLTKVFNFEILVDDSSIEIDSVNNHLQIKTDGVQNSHLNPNCAGSGLTQDVNGALQPDIDNTTIEINSSNKLAVKDSILSALPLDVTRFNNNLSSSDNTVQKALDTLDDLILESSTLADIEEIDGGSSITIFQSSIDGGASSTNPVYNIDGGNSNNIFIEQNIECGSASSIYNYQ